MILTSTVCLFCMELHEVQEVTEVSQTTIQGINVSYESTYYECTNTLLEDNRFVTAKMMDENLLNARNSYKKCM